MPRFLLLSRASSDGQSVGFHASVQVQQPVHVCQQGPLRVVGRDIEATLHHNNSGLTNWSVAGLEPGTNEFAGREQPSELFSTPRLSLGSLMHDTRESAALFEPSSGCLANSKTDAGDIRTLAGIAQSLSRRPP